MIRVDADLHGLADRVSYVMVNCTARQYPIARQTYDEAWEELRVDLARRRFKLGEVRYGQLMEMIAQAKAHFDDGADDEQQLLLGAGLMRDVERLIRGRSPLAYPEELYRWPRLNDN